MESFSGHSFNLISIIIAAVVLFSFASGVQRGAKGSAKRLFLLLLEGILTISSIYIAWKLADSLSGRIKAWLVGAGVEIPAHELAVWQQMYYTLITSFRDFPLLRFGLIFILLYGAVKAVLQWSVKQLWGRMDPVPEDSRKGAMSGLAGGLIGSIIGVGRAFVVVALLFVYVTLFPSAGLSGYIQASSIYQHGARLVIEPVTSRWIADKAPGFTRAVETEFNQILKRKYEVIDHYIPPRLEDTAAAVTAGKQSDEAKARALYEWIGSRIEYDWEKVRLYEEDQIWKEQTPEETFEQRLGVCIDYSRLYAMMARSVGLEVQVVTGLGYDGRGGYGPHAWNEVYLSEQETWVPLDSTWASSGGNWFNPPNFDDTHIKDA